MEATKWRGIALMVGAMVGFDIFSALMSSPWSTEAFGATETRAASARRLISMSVVGALAFGGLAAWLTDNPWAAVGAAAGSAFMWWNYDHALTVGAQNGYGGVNLATSKGS